MFNINILWEKIVKEKYDRNALTEEIIEKVLQPNNITKDSSIADLSVGTTGFISFDLLQKGYNVKGFDGDPYAVKKYNKKLEKNNFNAAECMLWQNLDMKYKEAFDFVILKGRSLPYAATWNSKDGKTDINEVISSINSIYNSIKQGGFLFIDTNKDEEVNTLKKDFCKIKMYGIKFKVDWGRRLEGDTLYWISNLRKGLFRKKLAWPSQNFSEKNFVSMLYDAEFNQINEIKLDNETIYKTYLVKK